MRSAIRHQFRDRRLYIREAEADLTGTNLGQIVQRDVSMAECRQIARDQLGHGHSQATLESMAQALRDRTVLEVEVAGSRYGSYDLGRASAS